MNTSFLRSTLAACLAVAGLCHGAEAPASTDAGDTINQARALLQKWADTQRMIAAERHEWEQGKTLLEGRIALVEQSITDMKAKIAETETKLEEVRKRAAESETEKAQAKEAAEALLAQAGDLETGVRALVQRVPPAIQEKVKVLADRIPKEGAEVKNITAAERYQNVLGILNELNKANLEIISAPEIHDVGGGKKAEVKAIYIGLGQGYFLNAAGDIAGQGVPGKDAWVWTTDTTIAPQMKEVVEVMKKSVAPKLVSLPVTLD